MNAINLPSPDDIPLESIVVTLNLFSTKMKFYTLSKLLTLTSLQDFKRFNPFLQCQFTIYFCIQ